MGGNTHRSGCHRTNVPAAIAPTFRLPIAPTLRRGSVALDAPASITLDATPERGNDNTSDPVKMI